MADLSFHAVKGLVCCKARIIHVYHSTCTVALQCLSAIGTFYTQDAFAPTIYLVRVTDVIIPVLVPVYYTVSL